MNDFVTVLTMAYPQQLYIIKGRLESEGIECFIKDELTVQSNNLWSNAVGGVKLQVQNKDVRKATEILFELGYINNDAIQPEDILIRIDRQTAFIPILNKLKVTNRIVALALLLFALITTISYEIIKPSKFDLLTSNIWTIDKIYYKNKIVGPKTKGIENIPGRGDVDFSIFGELATFAKNGALSFPGMNSMSINGNWSFDGNEIILKMDTLSNLFNNSYDMDISNDKLILKSSTTTILAHVGR